MLAKTLYELHYNCHEMVDLAIPSCVGGQEIFLKCLHFSLVLGITVISRAWLYFIRSFQKSKAKQKQQKKTSSHPFPHMQVCASLGKFTGNNQSLEAVHTSFAGAWHAHLYDGADDSVVPVAFANQVNYPVCDLFNRVPV